MTLADEQTPLVLADGTLVYPNGRIASPKLTKNNYVEIPTAVEAQKLVTNTRRKLADLPDVPKTMNVVSVVLSYSLYGLDQSEIALATGLTENQIGQIKMSPAYEDMYEAIRQSVLEVEATTVREIFAQKSKQSAIEIVEGLNSPERGERLVAAREILDRGGFRPADIVEHRHSMSGGLVIEVVKRDTNTLPTIDIAMDKEI